MRFRHAFSAGSMLFALSLLPSSISAQESWRPAPARVNREPMENANYPVAQTAYREAEQSDYAPNYTNNNQAYAQQYTQPSQADYEYRRNYSQRRNSQQPRRMTSRAAYNQPSYNQPNYNQYNNAQAAYLDNAPAAPQQDFVYVPEQGSPQVVNSNANYQPASGIPPYTPGYAPPAYPTPPTVAPAGVAPLNIAPIAATGQDSLAYVPVNSFSVFGEYLLIQPRGANVAFAVPQDSILLAGSVPTGTVATTDPGFENGFRFGGSIAMGVDSKITGTYSWYDNSTSASATATGTDVLNPLTAFPGTFNAGFAAQQADATSAIDFTFIDVDFQAQICTADRYWYGYIIGARFAQLDQDFNANYPFAPPDGTTTVTTNIDFSGTGPRFGLEGERVLFQNGGLRVYGKGVANFLVGSFDSNYTQSNQFNGTEVSTGLSDDRLVTVLDFEAGIAWVGPQKHFRVSGGYLISMWFNAVTTPVLLDAVQYNAFVTRDEKLLSFDGIAVRAEWMF